MANLAHLQAVAAQLAARVRDDDPDINAAWLLEMLPDPADRFALHFVQAAATPVDKPWSQLVAWTEQPQLDMADALAQRREYWRLYKRRHRARAREEARSA